MLTRFSLAFVDIDYTPLRLFTTKTQISRYVSIPNLLFLQCHVVVWSFRLERRLVLVANVFEERLGR